MFEHKSEQVAPVDHFIRRLLMYVLMSAGIMVVALGMGVCGYHYLGELTWIDALVNASMILAGMGPVDKVTALDGKLFASFYALFSGLVFVISFGMIISPVAHRVLHRFHMDEDDLSK